MKKFQILVPYDFSEAAKNGLDYAVSFAAKHDDMEIKLCYITEEKDLDILEEAFQKKQTIYIDDLKFPMSWTLIEDSLTATINKIQEEKHIDLIIMGTSGIRHADSYDTHTSELMLEAHCPIISVPQYHEKFGMQHIALVLGPNEIDRPQVLQTLLDFSRRFNAKVHIVTIEEEANTYGYSEADEKNENTLQYYLENFYEDHTLVKNTDLVEGILKYAERKHIDLISILPRNHIEKAPSKGLLTHELAIKSEIPVLAIH